VDAEERTRQIEARKQQCDFADRLWCKDQLQAFPVYRVPSEALLLNPENKRFGTLRGFVERTLGRSLDPANNPADVDAIIKILLDDDIDVEDGLVVGGKPSKDYQALRRDWSARKQISPIWIRPDGTVHNGNRRVAMLLRETAEHGPVGREFVEAVILAPEEVSNRDLFEMEQREQFAENYKVRYKDIDLLLALREAAETDGVGVDLYDAESIERAGVRHAHVAGGDTPEYAVVQFWAIRAMDAYLDDLGAPGQYHLLRSKLERVRATGRIMRWAESSYRDDVADLNRVAFAFIKAGRAHGDILALKRLFLEDRASFDDLLAGIMDAEDEVSVEGAPVVEPELAELTASEADDDDDDNGDDEPTSPLVGYPVERVRSLAKNAVDALNASRSDVTDRVVQAWNRLDGITRGDLVAALALGGGGPAAPLAALVRWAQEMADLRDHDAV